MQVVAVDVVTDCGPRQFGWADTKSALTTLFSWLYLSGPFMTGATVNPAERHLNHERIRQFAKTMIGGRCRRSDSYQNAQNIALGPLEDWLSRYFHMGHADQGHGDVPPHEWLRGLLKHRVRSEGFWIGRPKVFKLT